MSEQEKIDLFKRIKESINKAQIAMLERKVKLGESVVIADNNGNPVVVSAEKALQIFLSNDA